MPHNTAPDFNGLMTAAQKAHRQGDFVASSRHWNRAAELAPNPLEKARAIRGDASSMERHGDRPYATGRAEEALDIHREVLAHEGDQLPAMREYAQSSTVLGAILLGTVVRFERTGILGIDMARDEALPGLTHMRNARGILLKIKEITGQDDQYSINLLSRLAIGDSLYGDRKEAHAYAEEAKALAGQSESSRIAGAANISFRYRRASAVIALSRAHASSLINRLATPYVSAKRDTALALAQNYRLGL